MGFKQHISRTWQMIEQQVNDVPFRPHDEAFGLILNSKNTAIFSNLQKETTETLFFDNASAVFYWLCLNATAPRGKRI